MEREFSWRTERFWQRISLTISDTVPLKYQDTLFATMIRRTLAFHELRSVHGIRRNGKAIGAFRELDRNWLVEHDSSLLMSKPKRNLAVMQVEVRAKRLPRVQTSIRFPSSSYVCTTARPVLKCSCSRSANDISHAFTFCTSGAEIVHVNAPNKKCDGWKWTLAR